MRTTLAQTLREHFRTSALQEIGEGARMRAAILNESSNANSAMDALKFNNLADAIEEFLK